MQHQQLDRRSLEFGRRIADRLLADPALLEIARENLRCWQVRSGVGEALLVCYAEWEDLLNQLTVEQVAELLQRDDEEAARLRQNSPFTGVLSPQEVWSIKREYAYAS